MSIRIVLGVMQGSFVTEPLLVLDIVTLVLKRTKEDIGSVLTIVSLPTKKVGIDDEVSGLDDLVSLSQVPDEVALRTVALGKRTKEEVVDLMQRGGSMLTDENVTFVVLGGMRGSVYAENSDNLVMRSELFDQQLPVSKVY